MKSLLRNWKQRLAGRAASFVIMTRPLKAEDVGLAGNESTVVEVGEAEWPGTLKFFDENGFGNGWGERMRAGGNRCVVVRESGQIVAGGWMTTRPGWVYEVGYTFDCGEEGAYFFGDFVVPAFRGRWFQGRLMKRRLAIAAEMGRRWAYGIVWEGNLASIKNSQRAGCVLAGKLSGTYLGPWQKDRLEQVSADVPCGRFLSAGGRALSGTAWRRRYAPEREDPVAA